MAASSGGELSLMMDDSDTMQLIRQAILFENIDLLSDLVVENPWSMERIDRHGRTPLMLAAHNGKTESCKTLILFAVGSLDCTNGQGKTALHLAAEAGEVNSVKALLSAGADPTLRDQSAHCALEAAHIAGHEAVAAVLIEAIQHENENVTATHRLLIDACIEGNLKDVEEILAQSHDRNMDVVLNGTSPEDDTALFIACTNGHESVVRRLLKIKDQHVLVKQHTKDTVLHAAVSSQNVAVVEAILEVYPALIANSNCDGCSCLHWAAQSGSVEIVKSILEHDYPPQYMKEIDMVSAPPYRLSIDVNQGDSECRTALYHAVAKKHLEVIHYMLDFRIKFTDDVLRCPFQIDVYCSRGRTPLMVAAYNQALPVLTLLIDRGADVNLPLALLDGETNGEEGRCVGSGALLEAARADALHIVHFLLDKGALDTDNRALSLAATAHNDKLIRVFLTRLVFPDPEYKVNKKNVDVGQIQVGQNLLPSSLCPSRSAMLNWSGAHLDALQVDWFISAALQVNPRLRTTRLSLAAITRVDLSANKLRVFPTVLFQMPSLRCLNISDNQIASIDMPSYYVSSTSLEILNLKQNQLEALSALLLAALPQLQVLDVSHNKLSQLPEYVWLCPALKELNASHNLLSTLPMVGGGRGRGSGHPKLQAGLIPNDNVDSNIDDPPNVTTKPLLRQNIWQTSINLSKVDDDQLFPDFPVTSSNTLTTLNLSNNKFQMYPFCLACTCPRLVTLNMSYNQLIALPPVACIPAHLRNLDVSHNKLKECFQPVTHFHTVCHAVAPSISTTGMPRRPTSPVRHHRSRSKSAARSQRSLSVSRHQTADAQLEEACVHKRHDTLEWMKSINMSGNQITVIHVVAAGKVMLPALTVLDASDNKLKSVTADLAKMPGLSVLNLSGNEAIKELPSELGMLSRLWSLSLKGCQLREPLDSMVNVDNCKTVEIVAYLKTILEESKTFHHLRLMILGGDRVGKSTLWDGMRAEAVNKKQPVQVESVRVAEWKYEAKRAKGEPALGPISFAAWDFCGQREYHSTHQYFLTRRALYVIVWRVTDGEAALTDVQKWLVNIQARAPNSSVVLVGTHIDQVTSNGNKFPTGFLDDVEAKVRSRFMQSDSDKSGLPRVLDLLFISAKTKSDIKTLLNVVYKCSWDIRIGKERALDQQVPSSYVALLKVVRELASEMRKDGQPAVMSADNFKKQTSIRMNSKYGRPFRDDIEVHGACSFLHDSGELVHFEDAALREIVFIDPLWLADFLAAVVALRSPNRPAGLLAIEAISPLVKVSSRHPDSSLLRAALLDVLHKCELALICHPRQLLFPSLLPDEYQLRSDYPSSIVKVAAKTSTWSIRYPHQSSQRHQHIPLIATLSNIMYRTSLDEPQSAASMPQAHPKLKTKAKSNDVMFTFAYQRDHQLRRLYAMSYVPSGFWSRLVTRIIGDQNVSSAVEGIFSSNSKDEADKMKMACEGTVKAEWMVWQTGIEMIVKGHSLFVLKQFLPLAEVRDVDYQSVDVRCRDEQKRWKTFHLTEWAVLEMLFPSLSISAVGEDGKMTMSTDVEGTSRLLALIVDLVDTLLEDWYPSLGTRFVHTSEGELLVNRLVPCPKCAHEAGRSERRSQDDSEIDEHRDGKGVRSSKTMSDMPVMPSLNCFSIEECMLAGREYGWLECPTHSGVHMKDMAPDTVFCDIESSLLISSDNIRRGRLLGRGAFGFVFRATVKVHTGELCEVAQKMLEPVDPGPGGRPSALTAYKAAADKWRRDSLEFACRAYCTSRQELNLLSRMRHPNVVGLIGVCVSPLSLVVELAPLGALNHLLASHRKSGARLSLPVIRESAVQIARALEYLHSAHIIYRDLKSENVLGWRFPPAFSSQTDVLLKLGDYGISRAVLPSGGAKGFGGTEGFMAPEIVRFNGEEEYTQKVDCFSFGMFLYELITLKLPFEGEEHVKERLLDGARPVLLPHELLHPSPMLDLLVQCWSNLPDSRPSSSQLVGYCAAPEFTHLLDVCQLEEALPPCSLVCLPTGDELDDPDEMEAQLWMEGRQLTVMCCTQYGWFDQRSVSVDFRSRFLCRIRDSIWSCDESGKIAVFASSLHEVGKLQLPISHSPLVRPPEMMTSDVILLVTESQLRLLSLSDSNSLKPIAALDSPYSIKTAVIVPNSADRQVWTGHCEGRISVHHIANDNTFSFSSSLYMNENDVTIKQMVSNKEGTHVWLSVQNGYRVYCWDVERRQIVSSLDISKVMPGSETIHTLDMDLPAASQVTSFCLLERAGGSFIFIGTTRGLLIVANAMPLQPLSACRPYADDLTSLCIVEGSRDEEGSIKIRSSLSTASSSESGLGWVRERMSETMDRFRASPALLGNQGPALLVTVGRQFRSLSHRFVGETKLLDTYSVAVWRTEDWV